MAEEIDDNGFYREDFSAESDWEVFNAQLCDLFQKWELSQTADWGDEFDVDKSKWQIEEEQLEAMGKQMTIKYYKALLEQNNSKLPNANENPTPAFHEDLMSMANTFGRLSFLDEKPHEAHYLSRMYGLRRFVVIHPTKLQSHYLTSTSKFSFFLSSISVVAAEVCSAVPIFLRIHDPKWNFFLGVGMSSYMRTNFNLVALDQAPSEYLYLSGLVKMFKEKLPRHYDQHTAVVSVRNTYTLDTIKLRVPMYVPFGMTPLVDEERSVISISQFVALPHGYTPLAYSNIFLVFSWPELADNMFIDSALQTQFVPSKAPCGELHQTADANSYLTSCLKDYFLLITARNTLESYVGANFSGSLLQPSENLLGKRSKQYAETSQNKLPGPITEFELKSMLCYLFPELHPEMALFFYETSSEDKIDPHRIKSAEKDSLIHRLSCLLATVHAHFGGNTGMAQLYAAFTREIRSLWNSCIPIPGVAPGLPDIKTCLLHQKLQMLNVCIEKRLQREKGIQQQPFETEMVKTMQDADIISDDDDDTEEEEFYDLTDEEDAIADKQIPRVARSKSPLKAEGRLQRCNNMRLLQSQDYLYVPITQDAVPKTEDCLQDDLNAVMQMGSDSEYITDMMCSTVVSDVEAFKAANPKACFEDFIRWFSPNDWEEYSDESSGEMKYKLSARMQAPGNTWQKVWEQAKPVPALRQKRLFDDTLEGYKVLSYLESRNMGEIFGLTVVPLLHSAILKLKDILLNSDVLDMFSQTLEQLLADLSRFSRDVELVEVNKDPSTSSQSMHHMRENKYALQLPDPHPILRKIERLEKEFYQYKCFESFPGIKDLPLAKIQAKFREILTNNGCCRIDGPSDEFSLQSMFKDDMREKLTSKEYVMRLGEGLRSREFESIKAMEEKDNQQPGVTLMPQFLRAIVTGQKLRLCGAFTENTTFLD
ncbi:rab3 GTPase-activating protein catalytic subunit [Stomoxys calcitrans]|uniref:rab3 GTPase-activating protein catalytic subunit n=1 Tax=Stomoxys calcitrans TaxID=35570 RepID=UPI0027E31710|nr:rab3 GTPase-activating protein catalytic subunit [Stomoxys calcitrans]